MSLSTQAAELAALLAKMPGMAWRAEDGAGCKQVLMTRPGSAWRWAELGYTPGIIDEATDLANARFIAGLLTDVPALFAHLGYGTDTIAPAKLSGHQLTAIRARHAAASPGPWTIASHKGSSELDLVSSRDGAIFSVGSDSRPIAQFIVLAHEVVPGLLAGIGA